MLQDKFGIDHFCSKSIMSVIPPQQLFPLIIYSVFGHKKKTCRDIIDDVIRNPPRHTVVTSAGGAHIRYVCIDGSELVAGRRLRRCTDGRLEGSEPQCAVPSGTLEYILPTLTFKEKCVSEAVGIGSIIICYLSKLEKPSSPSSVV